MTRQIARASGFGHYEPGAVAKATGAEQDRGHPDILVSGT